MGQMHPLHQIAYAGPIMPFQALLTGRNYASISDGELVAERLWGGCTRGGLMSA